MNDKQFETPLAIMLFAMVSIVVGAWVLHAVPVPKPPTSTPQLTV